MADAQDLKLGNVTFQATTCDFFTIAKNSVVIGCNCILRLFSASSFRGGFRAKSSTNSSTDFPRCFFSFRGEGKNPRSRSRVCHPACGDTGQASCQSRERSPHFSLVVSNLQPDLRPCHPSQNWFQTRHHQDTNRACGHLTLMINHPQTWMQV
jgi:hypothetical protein